MVMKIVLVFVLVCAVVSGYPVSVNAQEPAAYWQQSAPEAQGIDSMKLADGLQAVRQNNLNVHSLMVIRNGSLIVDAYFYPYDGQTVHDLASVTKSVMTTLIGIAIDQGILSLDDPMLSFFPDRVIANVDERKERITVRHLASMSSGLDCTAEQDEATLYEMFLSPDWIQFTLDREMIAEPGTEFVYCSPGMHVLSAILQEATGMTALEFATLHLFEPLGITDLIWETDPQGYTHGWGDLYLHPRDAAKFGYLWLNNGFWEGEQIVSGEWVQASVSVQITTPEGYGDDYGFGWWVARTAPPAYSAQGRGGQRISVIPAWNVIVVTTGGGFEYDDVTDLLIPALIDPENPLPDDPTGVLQLTITNCAVLQPPTPQSEVFLPDTAWEISGKTFVLEPNPGNLASLRLEFNDSGKAMLYATPVGSDTPVEIVVGLDGVFRMRPGEYDLPEGMRGYWADEQTFVLESDQIANNNHTFYWMRFDGDHLVIETHQTAHEVSVTIEGRAQEP